MGQVLLRSFDGEWERTVPVLGSEVLETFARWNVRSTPAPSLAFRVPCGGPALAAFARMHAGEEGDPCPDELGEVLTLADFLILYGDARRAIEEGVGEALRRVPLHALLTPPTGDAPATVGSGSDVDATWMWMSWFVKTRHACGPACACGCLLARKLAVAAGRGGRAYASEYLIAFTRRVEEEETSRGYGRFGGAASGGEDPCVPPNCREFASIPPCLVGGIVNALSTPPRRRVVLTGDVRNRRAAIFLSLMELAYSAAHARANGGLLAVVYVHDAGGHAYWRSRAETFREFCMRRHGARPAVVVGPSPNPPVSEPVVVRIETWPGRGGDTAAGSRDWGHERRTVFVARSGLGRTTREWSLECVSGNAAAAAPLHAVPSLDLKLRALTHYESMVPACVRARTTRLPAGMLRGTIWTDACGGIVECMPVGRAAARILENALCGVRFDESGEGVCRPRTDRMAEEDVDALKNALIDHLRRGSDLTSSGPVASAWRSVCGAFDRADLRRRANRLRFFSSGSARWQGLALGPLDAAAFPRQLQESVDAQRCGVCGDPWRAGPPSGGRARFAECCSTPLCAECAGTERCACRATARDPASLLLAKLGEVRERDPGFGRALLLHALPRAATAPWSLKVLADRLGAGGYRTLTGEARSQRAELLLSRGGPFVYVVDSRKINDVFSNNGIDLLYNASGYLYVLHLALEEDGSDPSELLRTLTPVSTGGHERGVVIERLVPA